MKTLLINLLTHAVTKWRSTSNLSTAQLILIHIERARDPKFGDFASNIALVLAKICQRKPMDIAQELVQVIQKSAAVAEITVASPGFINFKIAEPAFHDVLQTILSQGQHYGCSTLGKNQSMLVEFVSSNPTGPLHVGHGRHAAYGASLCNILEATGYRVEREYYVNDAGRQICILAVSVWMRYLELFMTPIHFPRRGYQGSYVIGIAKTLQETHGDAFLRPAVDIINNLPDDSEESEEMYVDALIVRAEHLLGKAEFNQIFQWGLNAILQDMQNDLAEFGVTFQRWFYESELFKNGDIERGIQVLREAGFLYEKEGAVWFKATDFGDEKDRVIVRENGQPTYFASDVAYHLNKYERGFDHVFDVFGSDHHGYVPRIKALIQALGKDLNKFKALLIQFAILYRGKTRASMSTRGGDFVTLRQLRKEVGNDAARFFYIMRRREQHLDFDLELAKSQSSDNPVYYIQYAHARICSVFRQLTQKGWEWDSNFTKELLSPLQADHEKSLMRCLSRYPEAIETAAETYEPAVVAYYLQELANAFHAYYNATIFLVSEPEVRNARLYLIAATRQVLANGLGLLGVSAPEMM